MQHVTRTGIVALAVLLAAALGVRVLLQEPRPERTPVEDDAEAQLVARLDAALTEQATWRDTLAARFERVDDLKTAQEQALRRFSNARHLAAARRMGVGPPSSDEALERLADAGRLVRLGETPYYHVQELTVSVPYVTPELHRLLETLGRRFHAALAEKGLPPYRYCISSVLRTPSGQAALRRENLNAARGRSAHEYGTTIDIVYHTYDYLSGAELPEAATGASVLDARMDTLAVQTLDALGMLYWQELQGLLGRILIDLQREGVVLVTLEREQPVFHVTVAGEP